MMTPPLVEQREAQHYVGIRTQVPIKGLRKTIPELLGELFASAEQQGIGPAGPPFIRYHVIDMAGLMDVELGIPVADAVVGSGRITPGVLPAGTYAVLVYTGVNNGIKANAALLDWAAKQGITWDRWDAETGDAFACRIESFLTGPDEEPDRAKWQTEVAIKTTGG
jgi:effector-binding domain-containing protein